MMSQDQDGQPRRQTVGCAGSGPTTGRLRTVPGSAPRGTMAKTVSLSEPRGHRSSPWPGAATGDENLNIEECGSPCGGRCVYGVCPGLRRCLCTWSWRIPSRSRTCWAARATSGTQCGSRRSPHGMAGLLQKLRHVPPRAETMAIRTRPTTDGLRHTLLQPCDLRLTGVLNRKLDGAMAYAPPGSRIQVRLHAEDSRLLAGWTGFPEQSRLTDNLDGQGWVPMCRTAVESGPAQCRPAKRTHER